MVKIRTGLTFDDVLLEPQHSEIVPTEAITRTKLTKNIELHIPMVSAAMDTVTTAPLAIAIAREGGIGIIHKNMSIAEQAKEVSNVKRAEDGLILDPISVGPNTTVEEVLKIMADNKIGGIPIVDKKNKPIGIITKRDLRFETNQKDLSKKVKEFMTTGKKLKIGKKGISLNDAEKILVDNKIERLPIVDASGKLIGLITYRDSQKVKEKPLASKDANNQLLVGAAVGTSTDTLERVAALVHAGVDIVCLDSAHGDSKNVLDMLRQIKSEFPDLPVIVGNVATKAGAIALAEAGADAIKVGMGPGSICTTRIIAGCGVPQLTAIMDTVDAVKDLGIPIIADGGIKYSGDMTKALAAGASCIMAGSIFAGTEEAPGSTIIYEGRKFKSYRGMGSLGAMEHGSKDRYSQEKETDTKKLVPEGIEGRVPYTGTVAEVVHQFIGGLKSGMGYCGAKDLKTLQEKAVFIQITTASMTESHPHNIVITHEAPNYSR